MIKTVRLINKTLGMAHQIYPVSGKSGKLYGHAHLSATDACPVFEMPVEDYERDKFDIIGNTTIMQQWVPSFVETHSEFSQIPWKVLVQQAKAKGINTFKLDRAQIEAALKEKG